jgi:3-phenylpropionate/trans-cinnamate dioxygenase ferredoxin reductase component
MTDQFVIIGAGLAGAKAAETLRAEGFTGRIVLIGAEADRPYERPPLSKGQLVGTADRDEAFVHTLGWYAENDVDLRTGTRATAIDRAARNVTLDDGSTVGYDRLLIATGSSPRRIDLPGSDLDGVLYLRTLRDRERLTAALIDGARVVILGAGWIGLEVAAGARTLGASVTVVETLPIPLQRVLGDEVGLIFQRLHEAHGVTFHCGASVRELRGGPAVTTVVLADGTELPADVVVVGVGVQPEIELAQRAGIATANGISVDSALRTSDPRIFAAGDVANAQHPLIGRPVRVEHWANALNGGPVAAKAMLDQDVAFDLLPYFFSDQYDLGMEYSGYVAPGGYDQVVFRGDPVGGEFLAFWLFEGRVLAGMNVNVWDVQDDIQALVRAGYAGKAVDPARLADLEVPLASVNS